MTEMTVWMIAWLFYMPMHYLGPLLVALLSGRETPQERRRLLKAVVVDCTVSMILAFALAIWLFSLQPRWSMVVLLASLCAPYTHILFYRRRRDIPWRSVDED